MSNLKWRHDNDKEQALRIIKSAIDENGYSNRVKWDGNSASVSVGLGKILLIRGSVEETEIVLDCKGIFGDTVLDKCKEILAHKFPDGELLE